MGSFRKTLIINKYLLIAIIYFFFNSFLLPNGLLYTTILTPIFLLYLYASGAKNILAISLICALPYLLIHVYQGTQLFYYLRSLILVFTSFIFVFSFFYYLKNHSLEVLFPPIVKLNAVFLVVAILIFFTDYKEVFWNLENLTINVRGIPRLKMLTYEPSYYSLLFTPIVIYYLLKTLLIPTTWKTLFFYGFAIFLPLFLSFSLGVISGILLAFLTLIAFFFYRLIKFKKVFNTLLFVVVASVFTLVVLFIVYPSNPLFARIVDLVNGQDTSASGRTVYALKLAIDIAKGKSLWFGVGLGQIKIVGVEIIREFYHYNKLEEAAIRIPNAIGETIAMFGLTGLFIRLSLQIYLFVKTKVYSNYYRFSIFAFVFIYQFTGSYFHNPAELVLWVIAFSQGFHLFNVSKLSPR